VVKELPRESAQKRRVHSEAPDDDRMVEKTVRAEDDPRRPAASDVN